MYIEVVSFFFFFFFFFALFNNRSKNVMSEMIVP